MPRILPVYFSRLPVIAGLLLAAFLMPHAAMAADFSKYHNYDEMTAALRALATANPQIARLAEIGKTRGGRSLWALEIANPAGIPVNVRPALLVAANFEGDQLIGSELALFTADYLINGYATNADIKKKLDNHVFYVIPRMNPDAAEGMFATLKATRKTNTSPRDDDNDGRIDEDIPEDLNGDGYISVMRVKDPKGAYMIHPDEPRLMRRADPQKGEAGGWSIHWEGIDNDGDGFINEDGIGGVDINRNFMHKYPNYEPDAGPYMVSETETRALLDFMLKHRNIALMLTFGESDNLVATSARGGQSSTIDLLAFAQYSNAEARRTGRFQSMDGFGLGGRGGFGGGGGEEFVMMGGGRGGQQQQAASQRPAGRRPAETVDTGDQEYFRAIGEKYRSLTGIRGTPAVRTAGGAFYEYGYFQFGVPSFSTPGWGLPPAQGGGPGGMAERFAGRAGGEETAQAPAATSGTQTVSTPFGTFNVSQMGGSGRGGRGGGDTASSVPPPPGGTAAFDLRLLKWLDAEKIDGFIPWTAHKHPTLGDVEIGGFKAYAYCNPPAAKIAELGKSHAEFVGYLSTLFAKVTVAKTAVTALGGGLYRIKAEIENSGFLPTSTAQGVTARAVKPSMVQLGVDPNDIVSGSSKTNFFQSLAGSGRRQSYDWIVRGKPGTSITLKVVSQKGGTDTATLRLE